MTVDRAMLVELLDWYLDAGVDVAIEDRPVDRLVPVPSLTPASTAERSRSDRPAPSTPPAVPGFAADIVTAIAEAEAAATAALSFDELIAAIERFDGCMLKRLAGRTVVFDGDPSAELMLIGEAPGAEEDRIGRPFVGPAGRLLDRMLAAIGRDRETVLITNTVFWRPPQNRRPTETETAICRPFVHAMIRQIAPKVLVLLGGTATGALLDEKDGITRLRGRWFGVDAGGGGPAVETTAMYHPSFLLRSPERKRESWIDLLAIKTKLGNNNNK